MASLGSMAMASRYRRPRHRRMLNLTVRGRERISPHFVSVTLGGDDFQHLDRSGYDQAGRLFFPRPGQDTDSSIPSSDKWMRQYALLPAAKRPRVRMYSIRRFRPEMSEIDIEVVIHEESPGTPAAAGSAWALAAEPGDRVGFLDEGYCYVPTPDATWQLLVGDESALPAVLAILERSADALPAEVFLERPRRRGRPPRRHRERQDPLVAPHRFRHQAGHARTPGREGRTPASGPLLHLGRGRVRAPHRPAQASRQRPRHPQIRHRLPRLLETRQSQPRLPRYSTRVCVPSTTARARRSASSVPGSAV